jgi:hypothetical protein
MRPNFEGVMAGEVTFADLARPLDHAQLRELTIGYYDEFAALTGAAARQPRSYRQNLCRSFPQATLRILVPTLCSDEFTMMLNPLSVLETTAICYPSTDELAFLDDRQLATRDAIRAQWDATEALVRAYLDRLTPAELQREVRPEVWPTVRGPIRVYQARSQVANHSTDHRAQTLAGLHRLGAPTVGQDVLDYLFVQQERTVGAAV